MIAGGAILKGLARCTSVHKRCVEKIGDPFADRDRSNEEDSKYVVSFRHRRVLIAIHAVGSQGQLCRGNPSLHETLAHELRGRQDQIAFLVTLVRSIRSASRQNPLATAPILRTLPGAAPSGTGRESSANRTRRARRTAPAPPAGGDGRRPPAHRRHRPGPRAG